MVKQKATILTDESKNISSRPWGTCYCSPLIEAGISIGGKDEKDVGAAAQTNM